MAIAGHDRHEVIVLNSNKQVISCLCRNMIVQKILLVIASALLAGCAMQPKTIDPLEQLHKLPDDDHRITEPLRLDLKSSSGDISAFGFIFGKTKLDELPLRCFYSNSKVFRQDENVPEEAPMLFLWTWENSGRIVIRPKKSRISECFGRGVRDISLSFANQKLSDIRATYTKDYFDKIRPHIASTIKKFGLACKAHSLGMKCNNRQIEIKIHNEYLTSDEVPIKVVEFEVKDKGPANDAMSYLKAHGFPRYGQFNLGLDTKTSLKALMKRAGYEQANNLDRLLNEYRTLNILSYPNGGAVVGELVTAEIFFDTNDVLYSYSATFNPVFRRKLDYVVDILGDEFLYQGRTLCWLINTGTEEPLIEEVFWHRDYLPEKTGGVPLYAVNVRVGLYSGYVHSMEITNPLFKKSSF